MCVYMHACVCVLKKRRLVYCNMADVAHFSKSISAPKGNLHGTIYEAEFTISVQLLGPTEKTAADMNLMEQRHLVGELVVRLCVVYNVGSVAASLQ